MLKCISNVKDWIVENPEKLLCGITFTVGVGTAIIFKKLAKYDNPVSGFEQDYRLYSIGYVEGGHQACSVIRKSLIEQFGPEKGQEIANKIADVFEKK